MGRAAAMALLFVALPPAAWPWGANATKLIVNKAIGTLPPQLHTFFDSNRDFVLQHVNDPAAELGRNSPERRNHYLYLDKYGRFPFAELPRSYKQALSKYGKSKLHANGLLPWQIGVFSQKLTEAMRAGHWDEARMDAALLADYVAEAHDPFNTTENSDGHLTGQTGIDQRFGTALVDRYASFFPMQPNDASFISDPTDHAFEACLASHSVLETILLADRNAHLGLNSYTDEYYDRFYNQAAAVLIRQLSDAATDAGSYWLTAWINAGRPVPPR
jgi:hypothetical protein